MLFSLFPSTPSTYIPLVAACLFVIGNAGIATAAVCSNAFLPGLAKEDEEVILAAKLLVVDTDGRTMVEEAQSLLSPVLSATTNIKSSSDTDYATLLSLTTARLSSTATGLGFLSGFLMLIALIIPVTILNGSTGSLRLAVGLSGLWWAVFTVPAWIGLPSGERERGDEGDRRWLVHAWMRVGRMVKSREMRALPNLYTFLFAWIFLSDGKFLRPLAFECPSDGEIGFHTTTYTAILYASSTLRMSASKIIIIGILTQLAGGKCLMCLYRCSR